ncbi:NAD(P)H-dependent glycerol-3-phosphate dehydrogenase [Streptomyces sp. NBC_01207]|uniref:NAD(P)H-dependent glycerol-3-phosphate dehydrogenase n=1 Tax=Streptomyces sp. NBC_01207 TaxID=2903772 RepID=UPI002E0F3749|nr:NAD(P)-dependent glycerol-3-phosphate dehydrogenase [Streptomyces sp. NBC_01207]
MTRIAVLSAGSWGTSMGAVLADAGNRVILHARRPGLAAAINTRHENPRYLPGITLPDTMTATTDEAEAIQDAEFVVISIPAQTLRENLTRWAPLIPQGAAIVSLMKGIETGTGMRMSQVITEVTGTPCDRVAVLSGPNLAREIAEHQPAASAIACTDEMVAARLQAAVQTSYFRPYTTTDVIGCELGGAVKNVIALAVGLATGMRLGDNARAVLVTRGLAETARFGLALGADPLTFSGLAGVGDLMATCTSPLSRNRTFGEHLGRGLTLTEAAAATGQTAEGVKSAESVLQLARRHGVEMPITEVVVSVLYGRITTGQAATQLMERAPRAERYTT